MKVCQVKQKRKIDPSACVGTGAEICNVACLPFTNVSGKSGWKVYGTCLFWVVPAGNFREQRNIWKASPVFPEGIFQSEFRVPFLPSLQFDTSFSPSQSFSGKSNWLNLYKWLTRFRGETYQSWIFAYHLPKPWTDRSAHANGKQPMWMRSSRQGTAIICQTKCISFS